MPLLLFIQLSLLLQLASKGRTAATREATTRAACAAYLVNLVARATASRQAADHAAAAVRAVAAREARF